VGLYSGSKGGQVIVMSIYNELEEGLVVLRIHKVSDEPKSFSVSLDVGVRMRMRWNGSRLSSGLMALAVEIKEIAGHVQEAEMQEVIRELGAQGNGMV